jgi:hypothetical protein
MREHCLLTANHYQPFQYSKGNNMAHLIKENGKLIIRDEWHEDDIQGVAEAMDLPELTPDQIEAVMDLVVESFDANIGINWEVIENAVDQALEEA